MTNGGVFPRGMNVGGQERIKMADLRFWLEAACMQGVRTYIQSDNLAVENSLMHHAHDEHLVQGRCNGKPHRFPKRCVYDT